VYKQTREKYRKTENTYFHFTKGDYGEQFWNNLKDDSKPQLFNYLVYRDQFQGDVIQLVIGRRHNDLEIGVKHMNLAMEFGAKHVLFAGELQVLLEDDVINYNFQSGTFTAQIEDDLKYDRKDRDEIRAEWMTIMQTFSEKNFPLIPQTWASEYGAPLSLDSVRLLDSDGIDYLRFESKKSIERYAFLFAYEEILKCSVRRQKRNKKPRKRRKEDHSILEDLYDLNGDDWLVKQQALIALEKEKTHNQQSLSGPPQPYWYLEKFQLTIIDVPFRFKTYVSSPLVGVDTYLCDDGKTLVTVGGLSNTDDGYRWIRKCVTENLVLQFSPHFKPWAEFDGTPSALFNYRVDRAGDTPSSFADAPGDSDFGVGTRLSISSLHQVVHHSGN
jgi:hypothetical protein